MIAVFIIVGIVASFTLYDYFLTRNWQQITSATRNETVFAKRNRRYGAYAIRRDYNKRLVLIMGGIITGIGALYAATRFKPVEHREVKPEYVEYLYKISEEPPRQEPVAQTHPAEPAAPAQTTSAFIPPVVVDRDPITPPVTPPDPGTPVGTITQTGEPGFGMIPTGTPGTGTGTGGSSTTEPPKDPVAVYVDEPACFPGGMDKMKPYLLEHMKYPQTAIELGLRGKCYLQFVVSKTGDISDVKVTRGVTDCPECDREAVRVVKGMPRWRPGKIKGEPVNSQFNLPITFAFQ